MQFAKILVLLSILLSYSCKTRHHPSAMESTGNQSIESNTDSLALADVHDLGSGEAIVIIHPEFYKEYTSDAKNTEEKAEAIAYYTNDIVMQPFLQNLGLVPKQLGLVNTLSKIGFYEEARVVKGTALRKLYSLPSKILNLPFIRDAEGYFKKAIVRKYQEINSIALEKLGETKFIRGYDFLPANPIYTFRGEVLTIKATGGQIILGHMPDSALVLDLHMTVAAFNALRKINPPIRVGASEIPDDKLLRGLSNGSIDPRKYGITSEQIKEEMTNLSQGNRKFREIAVLRKFELDHQDQQLLESMNTSFVMNNFRKRNLTKSEEDARVAIAKSKSKDESLSGGIVGTENWKTSVLSSHTEAEKFLGPNNILNPTPESRLTLDTPDRSTISNPQGFKKLVNDFNAALDEEAITFVHCKSGQGRSATVVAGVYIKRILKAIPLGDLQNITDKEIAGIIDHAIQIVEHPVTGRIQAKISGQQRPVLEEFAALEIRDIVKAERSN